MHPVVSLGCKPDLPVRNVQPLGMGHKNGEEVFSTADIAEIF